MVKLSSSKRILWVRISLIVNKQLEEEKAKVEEYLNWYDDTLEQLKESQDTVNKLKDLLNK